MAVLPRFVEIHFFVLFPLNLRLSIVGSAMSIVSSAVWWSKENRRQSSERPWPGMREGERGARKRTETGERRNR